ncbi:phage tail protein [Pseudomonas sp. S9]|uniref:phage tail protein n=1 Tax=Pseudomonas sp. S9 TaxID=686578 RepID=UPI0002556F5A|nr:phage tail protein [Pseudomonas sp. S9]
MSSGNLVGGVVGAAVGFVASGFNPVGAAYGFAIGFAAGGLLDPPKGPTVEGPRLSDLSLQTSTFGRFLARFYGKLAVTGNIIWLEGNKLKETVKKKKQGGKGGGGGTTTKTYTYSATFAIALGEGQLAAVTRIWCRDKLLYYAGSDDLETIIASNQSASGWRFYPGSDDQLPDPRIEAEKAAGPPPEIPGTPYIVFDDFQLEDYGNTLEGAQFKFELFTARGDLDREVDYLGIPVNQDWYGAGYSTSFASAGNQYDSEGFSNYVAGKYLTGGVTWIRTISGFLETQQLICPIFQEFGTVDPVANNLASNKYAFRYREQYLCIGSTTACGYYNTGASRFPVSVIDASDASCIFVSESGSGLIHKVVRCETNDGGLTYTKTHEVTTSVLSSIAEADGLVYALSGDGGDIDISVFNADDLTLVDSYSLFHGSIFSLQPNGSAISIRQGEMVVIQDVSSSSVPILRIDLESKSISRVGTIPVSFSGLTKPEYFAVTRFGSLLYLAQRSVTGLYNFQRVSLELDSFTSELTPLADVIVAEMQYSSLITAGDIDTSLITDNVRGYQVSGGSIRSALEPLQGVWPFDVIQSGYKLKCVPRGQASVATIPWEHLGANDGDEPGDLLKQSREMDTQLPASTHIKYWDVNREYAQGEQYADRPGTSAVNRVDLEVALVMNAQEAARAVDVLQALRWLERIDFEASLPPIYLALEPADVITILYKNATYQLRIKEKNDTPSGIGQCKLVPNAPSIYTTTAKGAEGVSPPGTIPLAGPTMLALLDIPLVDEISQNAPGFVGVASGYTDGWPGALAVRSADNGQTWDSLQAFTGKATFGLALNVLPASPGYLVDQRTLNVSLLSGDLESITYDQLLTGYNYCAYGVNGRWEIVRFQNSTQNADGSYTLSGFVRGDKGTEWATGLHQIGDAFVLLDDPDNAFIGSAVQTIGLERLYRGVTQGASIDSASDIPFTYNGVNLEPLSPVDARATRDGSGNLSVTFVRRSRLGSTWWGNGVDAPIGVTTQAYEIDVMRGSTVKRTITASTPAFSYSAANQTTDFGSVQASITFRIYQLSDTVGRGFVREVTL